VLGKKTQPIENECITVAQSCWCT